MDSGSAKEAKEFSYSRLNIDRNFYNMNLESRLEARTAESSFQPYPIQLPVHFLNGGIIGLRGQCGVMRKAHSSETK